MKTKFGIIILPLMLISAAFGQNLPDTVIGTYSYKIIERFKSGKVKQVGNFTKSCSDTTTHKSGQFITFNEKGKQIHECVYCYDKRICRRILGLKQGRWGIYGPVRYYFLGFVTRRTIVDPCF